MDSKHVGLYIIDLTTIDGSGEFECPKCGNLLSPDDETENTYKIEEIITKEDFLEKVILRCSRCGSSIHLVGFDTLD